MNKQFKLVLTAVAAAAAFASMGASAATGNGTSTATVIVPISIANNTAIAFGKFTKAAGVITMTPAGGRTASGGATTLSTITPGNPGQLTVTGDEAATYTIAVAGGSLTGPGTAMALDNITVAAADATGDLITSGTIGVGGTQVLMTGGELTVAADQVSGDYTGSYTVTVEYN